MRQLRRLGTVQRVDADLAPVCCQPPWHDRRSRADDCRTAGGHLACPTAPACLCRGVSASQFYGLARAACGRADASRTLVKHSPSKEVRRTETEGQKKYESKHLEKGEKMLRTRLTEVYGLEVPFIGDGMGFMATPPLVAAVSNSGGIGTIGAEHIPTDRF